MLTKGPFFQAYGAMKQLRQDISTLFFLPSELL